MNLTAELYRYAADRGITILETDCPECKAIAIKSPTGAYYIGIDRNVTKDTVMAGKYLAHELGHILSGALYPVNAPRCVVNSCEYQADIYAAVII